MTARASQEQLWVWVQALDGRLIKDCWASFISSVHLPPPWHLFLRKDCFWDLSSTPGVAGTGKLSKLRSENLLSLPWTAKSCGVMNLWQYNAYIPYIPTTSLLSPPINASAHRALTISPFAFSWKRSCSDHTIMPGCMINHAKLLDFLAALQ